VLGKWGKCGEYKVLPLTDNPDRFRLLNKVYIDKAIDTILAVDVHDVKKKGSTYLLTLSVSLEEDERIISQGTLLKVPVQDVPPVSNDSYYFFQIKDLAVKTTEGRFLGIVNDIIQTGSNDVFVVKGQKEYLIPFINDIVVNVNLEEKTITIFPMPGLVDEM
jgi:16S rRNA processing protein RimM